jgi:hypothetical protein
MIAYIFLFILGICFCFYYKYKIVIEGLKCDPDKPKVYPTRNGKRYGQKNNSSERGYEPSSRECQDYYENKSSENLDLYENELEKIKKELNDTKTNFDKERILHNENIVNTRKLISSLNCKRDRPRKGDIDCSESASEDESNDEGEGEEVDLDGESENARNNAAKAQKPSFPI